MILPSKSAGSTASGTRTFPGRDCGGKGTDINEAAKDLSERRAQHAHFLEETGAPPLDLLDRRPQSRSFLRSAGRLALLLLVFALCAVPISYGLSSGIERGVRAATSHLQIKTLLADLEQGLIDLSRPENDFDPERAKALREAMTRLADRLRPFTLEATRLFTEDKADRQDATVPVDGNQ